MARPDEFRALAAAEFALAFGGDAEHLDFLLGAGAARGEQAVTFADEQVADIQRDGDAVFFVQRLFAVTLRVVVLDVVVDERGFVEAFDGDGDLAQILGQRRAGRGAQRLIGGDGEERAPAFAGAAEPFAGDLFRLALRRDP